MNNWDSFKYVLAADAGTKSGLQTQLNRWFVAKH